MNAPLLATSPEERDEPTLYSKGYSLRAPVDNIAPQHVAIHGDLIRWGVWNRARRANSNSGSIEAFYTKGGTPPSTAPMAADPRLMAIERAVLRMPEEHNQALKRLYVKNESPWTICRHLRMRYEAYGPFMFTARAMVLNLLRRHGI